MSVSLDYTPTVVLPPCTPTTPVALVITMPGGGQISLIADTFDAAVRALLSANLPLVALAPLFLVLKAVSSIVSFIVNLPSNVAQAIAFNPKPLVDSVNNVISSTVGVIQLALPPVAFALMARGLVQLLRNFLVALKARIDQLAARYARVDTLIELANNLGNAGMLANATCAREDLDSRVARMNAQMGAATVLIGLVNVIICLVTLGQSEGLGPLPSADPTGATSVVFDPVIAVLDALLALIPNVSTVSLEC